MSRAVNNIVETFEQSCNFCSIYEVQSTIPITMLRLIAFHLNSLCMHSRREGTASPSRTGLRVRYARSDLPNVASFVQRVVCFSKSNLKMFEVNKKPRRYMARLVNWSTVIVRKTTIVNLGKLWQKFWVKMLRNIYLIEKLHQVYSHVWLFRYSTIPR